jgi:hypothetical protein
MVGITQGAPQFFDVAGGINPGRTDAAAFDAIFQAHVASQLFGGNSISDGDHGARGGTDWDAS